MPSTGQPTRRCEKPAVIIVDVLFLAFPVGEYRPPPMDTETLRDVYTRYAPKVHRYLTALCGSNERAFDMMQETFLAADRYYKEGKIENIEAWLITIARNIFRKEARRETANSPADVSQMQIADTRQDPTRMDFGVLREKIDAALRGINPLFGEIFTLRLDLDLTHAQIGEALDIPLITVRRHFDKIKAIIEQHFGDELGIL